MIKNLRKLVFAKDSSEPKEDFDIVDGEIITSYAPSSEPIPRISTNENVQALPEEDTLLLPQKELKAPGKKGRPKKIDGFFWHLQASGRSLRTIQEYKKDLRFWKKIATANKKTIYTLTVEEIEKAIISKKPSRKRRLIASLKSLAKFYLRGGHNHLYIECQKIVSGRKEERIPKHKDKDEFIEIRERAKELCKSGDRRGVWLGLMLMCGLRISEIQTANPGKDFIHVIGKGNKERKIPCTAWLIEAIKKMEVIISRKKKEMTCLSQLYSMTPASFKIKISL